MELEKAIEILKSELVCRPLGYQELLKAIDIVVKHIELLNN